MAALTRMAVQVQPSAGRVGASTYQEKKFSGRDIERSPGNASVSAVQLRSYGSSVQIMKTPLEEACCSEDGRVVEWKVHREERGVWF